MKHEYITYNSVTEFLNTPLDCLERLFVGSFFCYIHHLGRDRWYRIELRREDEFMLVGRMFYRGSRSAFNTFRRSSLTALLRDICDCLIF